jgi:hypothetical protein
MPNVGLLRIEKKTIIAVGPSRERAGTGHRNQIDEPGLLPKIDQRAAEFSPMARKKGPKPLSSPHDVGMSSC